MARQTPPSPPRGTLPQPGAQPQQGEDSAPSQMQSEAPAPAPLRFRDWASI